MLDIALPAFRSDERQADDHRPVPGQEAKRAGQGLCQVQEGRQGREDDEEGRPRERAGGLRGQCFRKGTPVLTGQLEHRPIEETRMGQRVMTWLSGEAGLAESLLEPDEWIDPATHRVIWYAQEWEDGTKLEVGHLRSLEWIAEAGITEVGDIVEMDLPEMGADGEFQVMAIEPCPEIEPGPGRLITGEFQFSKGLVYDLRISGQDKPIRGTSEHPYWSEDRLDWVRCDGLRTGERLLVEGGTAVVLSVEASGEEPVFNIEVEYGDHSLWVGERGCSVRGASRAGGRMARAVSLEDPGMQTDASDFVRSDRNWFGPSILKKSFCTAW